MMRLYRRREEFPGGLLYPSETVEVLGESVDRWFIDFHGAWCSNDGPDRMYENPELKQALKLGLKWELRECGDGRYAALFQLPPKENCELFRRQHERGATAGADH